MESLESVTTPTEGAGVKARQQYNLQYEGRYAKEINIHVSGREVYDLSHQAPNYQRISVGVTLDGHWLRVSYYNEKGKAMKHNDFPAPSVWVEVEYAEAGL